MSLTAGNGVYLTGYDLPRPNDAPCPCLLPPTVIINAGPGGVVLDTPSAIDANGQQCQLVVGLRHHPVSFPLPKSSNHDHGRRVVE